MNIKINLANNLIDIGIQLSNLKLFINHKIAF